MKRHEAEESYIMRSAIMYQYFYLTVHSNCIMNYLNKVTFIDDLNHHFQ
jgi:hypothetical protein